MVSQRYHILEETEGIQDTGYGVPIERRIQAGYDGGGNMDDHTHTITLCQTWIRTIGRGHRS